MLNISFDSDLGGGFQLVSAFVRWCPLESTSVRWIALQHTTWDVSDV